jgi:hypothetical protein
MPETSGKKKTGSEDPVYGRDGSGIGREGPPDVRFGLEHQIAVHGIKIPS